MHIHTGIYDGKVVLDAREQKPANQPERAHGASEPMVTRLVCVCVCKKACVMQAWGKERWQQREADLIKEEDETLSDGAASSSNASNVW